MANFRYSIGELILAVTLIAVGLGLCSNVFVIIAASGSILLGLCAWFSGWGIMGTGFGVPFQKTVLGTLIGLLFGLLGGAVIMLWFIYQVQNSDVHVP